MNGRFCDKLGHYVSETSLVSNLLIPICLHKTLNKLASPNIGKLGVPDFFKCGSTIWSVLNRVVPNNNGAVPFKIICHRWNGSYRQCSTLSHETQDQPLVPWLNETTIPIEPRPPDLFEVVRITRGGGSMNSVEIELTDTFKEAMKTEFSLGRILRWCESGDHPLEIR